jgi:hypothetical protein
MGAYSFATIANGETAKDAFDSIVRQARHEYGHGGYTGTIAEKDSFIEIDLPEGEDPHKFVERLMRDDDERISDKWGPAGCMKLDGDEYVFFGMASS